MLDYHEGLVGRDFQIWANSLLDSICSTPKTRTKNHKKPELYIPQRLPVNLEYQSEGNLRMHWMIDEREKKAKRDAEAILLKHKNEMSTFRLSQGLPTHPGPKPTCTGPKNMTSTPKKAELDTAADLQNKIKELESDNSVTLEDPTDTMDTTPPKFAPKRTAAKLTAVNPKKAIEAIDEFCAGSPRSEPAQDIHDDSTLELDESKAASSKGN